MATIARGKALVAKLRAQPGVRDPEALAAELGRKKKLRQAAKKAKNKVKGKAATSVPQSVKKAESDIVGNDYETGIVFSPDGKEIARSNRGDTSGVAIDPRYGVSLTDDELAKVRGNIFTHNHPGDESSFSDGDLGFFGSQKPKEMRAITPNYAHRLTWPEKFNPETSEGKAAYGKHRFDNNLTTGSQEWEKADRELQHLFDDPDFLSRDDFIEEYTHRVTELAANRLGFLYTREPR